MDKKAPSSLPLELPSDILGALEDLTLDNLYLTEMLMHLALGADSLDGAIVIRPDVAH